MKHLGNVTAQVDLFAIQSASRWDWENRFPIARAELLTHVPNACILSVYDVEAFNEKDAQHGCVVGVLYVQIPTEHS